MSVQNHYKIKIETENGDFYVTEYYSNKFTVKITLSQNENAAHLFRGSTMSGSGTIKDGNDVYGNEPNYTPSVTVYYAIKNNKWFISHTSVFVDLNGNLMFEEKGKKKIQTLSRNKGQTNRTTNVIGTNLIYGRKSKINKNVQMGHQ